MWESNFVITKKEIDFDKSFPPYTLKSGTLYQYIVSPVLDRYVISTAFIPCGTKVPPEQPNKDDYHMRLYENCKRQGFTFEGYEKHKDLKGIDRWWWVLKLYNGDQRTEVSEYDICIQLPLDQAQHYSKLDIRDKFEKDGMTFGKVFVENYEDLPNDLLMTYRLRRTVRCLTL